MGELKIASDIELSGIIRCRSPFPGGLQAPDVNRINFGGIENEGRFVGAGGVIAKTGGSDAPTIVTNGYPRVVMADGVTTDVYVMIQIDEWWLKHRLGIQFEFINDAAGTGNIRFQYECKELDIFVDTPAAAASIISRSENQPSGPAGTTSTVSIAHATLPQGSMPFTPGIFGNCYPLRISRLGGDGVNDTLVGDIGFVAASWFHSLT